MRLPADVRLALRRLGKSRGFALASVLILALGIGLNTAVFSIVHSVILNRFPYVDSSRLVYVWEHLPGMADPPGGRIQAAWRNFAEWRRQNDVFAGMAAYREVTFTETGIPSPKPVRAAPASVGIFALLGVRPALGRFFRPEEEQRGRDLVAVLSDRYFEERFGRDPSCIGKTIVLDGAGYTVIGVLPEKFHLPATWEGMDQLRPRVWVPLSRLGNSREDQERRQLLVIARLNPGVNIAQARTAMNAIAQRLSESDPKLNQGWSANVFSIAQEDTNPKVHRALLVMLVAVALVLLLACANLANLTLARAARRMRDVAVRIALGAGSRDVIRELVAESLVLALAGGALGVLLAHWGILALRSADTAAVQRPEMVRLNLPVLGFAAAASLLTVVLVSLAPALAAARADVLAALKVGGATGASVTHSRGRQILISAEVALALLLLAGAAFMMRSFYLVITADLGYRTDRLLYVDLDLPEKKYKDDATRIRFNRQLLERLAALPGVATAAVTDNIPLHRVSVVDFHIPGRPEPKPGSQPMADFANVSPGYFSAMGIRLRAGRLFTDADLTSNDTKRDGLVIINETFAERFWSGEQPVGRSIRGSNGRNYEIIGVVGRQRQLGAENESRPQLYWPWIGLASPIVVVRTHSGPAGLIPAVRREIQAMDAALAPSEMRTMTQMREEWISERRLFSYVLGGFAVLALVLAASGIYAVLAHVVASRTREIGIRMALGARRTQVVLLVFRQMLWPAGAGVAVGLAGTYALSRYLESLLYGVRARDPWIIGATVAGIAAVAAMATLLPARRATLLDPGIALREE